MWRNHVSCFGVSYSLLGGSMYQCSGKIVHSVLNKKSPLFIIQMKSARGLGMEDGGALLVIRL